VDVAAEGRTWSFFADAPSSPSPSILVSADPPLGADASRVRAALARALGHFGFKVQVSAQAD
jgi:hypothetical protein